jgi:hypothetical protein
MRITLTRILPFLACFWFAASAAAGDDNFSGRYEGRMGDTPAILKLRVSGSMVSGQITRPGNGKVELDGTTVDGRIVGAATTSRGAGFFEAYREFGALIVVIRESGSVTGQPVEARAEFQPADESSTTEETVAEPAQRDHELVGTWVMRGLGRRGDMVLPVKTTMRLDANGTYSATSEPPDESRRGEWRSRDGLLEYQPGKDQSWSALGEYRLHGDKLIIILPGNEAQVWTRND